LIKELLKLGEKNIIAEGNFSARSDVAEIAASGVHNICVGGAISNVYKLTKKYTSVRWPK